MFLIVSQHYNNSQHFQMYTNITSFSFETWTVRSTIKWGLFSKTAYSRFGEKPENSKSARIKMALLGSGIIHLFAPHE